MVDPRLVQPNKFWLFSLYVVNIPNINLLELASWHAGMPLGSLYVVNKSGI